eukprot:GHUV01000374.1.p1 GENE.GHUV01000374.1~~GHUV01000374.1.p1  ORF type:complete len:389 (+),score=53.56 GHUV01000374.1:122-1288(+)
MPNAWAKTAGDINWDNFKSFFAKNPGGVYLGPPHGIVPDTAHAVICHGYNNDQEYWTCLNSWGPDFGVHGSFKIKYGVCDMMADGQTYGVTWTPKDKAAWARSKFLVTPLELAGPQPGQWLRQPGCYEYTARPGDSIASIATKMWGVPSQHPEKPLQQFLKNNSNVITSLEASVVGKTLKICKPRPDAVMLGDDISVFIDSFSGTETCTASKLVGYGWEFLGTDQRAQSLHGVRVADENECCRLCAATAGCQFWWYLHYTPALTCTLSSLNDGPVMLRDYNKARGGIITTGPNPVATWTDQCSGVWLLKDVEFFGGQRPNWGPNPKDGAVFGSWQGCCQQARKDEVHYWTYDSDKRCWYKFYISNNEYFGMRRVKQAGTVSGIILPAK